MTAARMVVALNDVLVSGQEVAGESSIEGNGGDRTKTHSWDMFAKPIGDLEKRLSSPQLKDLGLYPAMRTESFQKLKKIASNTLEAANKEKSKLVAEALARQEEVSRLKPEFEEFQKEKAEAEAHMDSSLGRDRSFE
ncbi:hypothetical protein Adt_39367 [Abeliophyllum distichum]|uniref:Uncharacterized protein n=1 Tax=Abeliophyllum distichum TaxID=126358 RepID=A0ABD1Q4V2_9LAMI